MTRLTTQQRERRDTALGALDKARCGSCIATQFSVSRREGYDTASPARNMARSHARARSDMAGHRHNTTEEGATIKPSALHDTEQYAAWAKGGCTVHSTQF